MVEARTDDRRLAFRTEVRVDLADETERGKGHKLPNGAFKVAAGRPRCQSRNE